MGQAIDSASASRTLAPAGRLALGLTLTVAALLLYWQHDRFWWPPDEGVYAYVADRMLRGAVLHRDLQDLHPGYPQLANAGALALFGRDLVSLRYPLVAMALLQSWMAFHLLRGAGPLVAVPGGLAAAALTLPLFPNPSASWYVLFAACLLGTLLAAWPRDWHWRIVGAGALVGFAFFSRQSTGAFLGAGTLLFLLLDLQRQVPRSRRQRALLAPALLGTPALLLAGYLADRTSGLALPLYGLWPLALLLLGAATLRPPDRLVWPLLLRLAAGFLLAALPLVLAGAAEGALGAWLRDTFVTPWRNIAQPFFAFPGYTTILAESLRTLAAPADGLAVASALLWLGFLLLPPAVGATLVWRLRQATQGAPAPHPLVLLAPFHALVAVHFQIPDYLYYGLAPMVWAALWLAPGRGSSRPLALLVTLAMAVALATQAAQPRARSLAEIVSGRTLALDAEEGLPGASLAMTRSDQRLYTDLLQRIAEATADGGGILALPMNPELYFLSGRHPPVAWYASQLGLAGPEDVAAALAILASDPPRLLIHRADDKYNTAESDALLAALLPRYQAPETLGPFTLYRLRDGAP